MDHTTIRVTVAEVVEEVLVMPSIEDREAAVGSEAAAVAR